MKIENYDRHGNLVSGTQVPQYPQSFTYSSGASFTPSLVMSSGNANVACQSSYAGAQTVNIPSASGSLNIITLSDTGGTAGTHAVTITPATGSISGMSILNVNGMSLTLLDIGGSVGWQSI